MEFPQPMYITNTIHVCALVLLFIYLFIWGGGGLRPGGTAPSLLFSNNNNNNYHEISSCTNNPNYVQYVPELKACILDQN